MKRKYIVAAAVLIVIMPLAVLASCRSAAPYNNQPPASNREQPPDSESEQPLDSDNEQPPADFIDKQYMTSELEIKLAAGLADPNPLISHAWTMIKRDIETYGQFVSVIFLDAEIIRLECTDRFEDLYDDRVIEAYALEYRLKPDDPSKIGLVDATSFDEEGWLLDTISMGRPWLVAENREGEISVISSSHPMGEGRGVPLTALHILMYRDLEQGLDIAKLTLASIGYSINYHKDAGIIYFQIPELYPQPEDFDIRITGCEKGETGTVRRDFLAEENAAKNWEAGGVYRILIGDADYAELLMSVALPGPEGKLITQEIDLLSYMK
jgi:hypothetical protein